MDVTISQAKSIISAAHARAGRYYSHWISPCRVAFTSDGFEITIEYPGADPVIVWADPQEVANTLARLNRERKEG